MKTQGKYILHGRTPKLCADLLEWAWWLETADRKVAFDDINGVCVSTIFLGLDHSVDGNPPLLFETKVFGGALDGQKRRYATWEEAEAGHREMVEQVRASEQWPSTIEG